MDIQEAISNLDSDVSGEDRDRLLADLIANDDPYLAVELQQRALSAARGTATSSAIPRRTAAELLERARALGDARRKKEAAERARQTAKQERESAERRKEHLKSLRGKETTLWSKVHQLIDTRQPKGYDEAVALLRDLRDLAEMQEDAGTFRSKMTELRKEHVRKKTLVERFRKSKLLGRQS